MNDAAGHQRDEVVLHWLRAVLSLERRSGLAGAREADDHDGPRPFRGGHHFAAGMHGQPASIVDHLVPHPQPPLLRFAEVVGVEDARHAVFQVNGDAALVRVAGSGKIRRVDDRQLRVAGAPLEIKESLHARDVRAALLDDQSGRRLYLRRVGDVAVDNQHVGAAHVLVLDADDALVAAAAHRLVAAVRLGVVGYDVG